MMEGTSRSTAHTRTCARRGGRRCSGWRVRRALPRVSSSIRLWTLDRVLEPKSIANLKKGTTDIVADIFLGKEISSKIWMLLLPPMVTNPNARVVSSNASYIPPCCETTVTIRKSVVSQSQSKFSSPNKT
jgi:hypothetical protein